MGVRKERSLRILFVVNQIPFPPDNGVRIVIYHAMRLMHEAGHDLALAVLTEELGSAKEEYLLESTRLCGNSPAIFFEQKKRNRLLILISSLLRRTPFFVERYRSEAFKARLVELAKTFRPDAVHLDLIPMAQYRECFGPETRKIASINDSYALTLKNMLASRNYRFFLRLIKSIQYRGVRRYEKSILPAFSAVHVMTHVDAEYLRSLDRRISTCVIPNGIDECLYSLSLERRFENSVVFVAQLSGQNLVFLDRFLQAGWPRVRKDKPETRLLVAGRLTREAASTMRRAEKIGGVVFMGYLDRLDEVYAQSPIAIVPVDKTSGLLNKAIEAMGAGLAVIGFHNTFVPIKGSMPGKNCICVADYEEMGTAVVSLLNNDDKRFSIQRAGRRLAEDHYRWESRLVEYTEMYGGGKETSA